MPSSNPIPPSYWAPGLVHSGWTFEKRLPPPRRRTPTRQSAMRRFVKVLSCASTRRPSESGSLFPTMSTSRTSQSDEPLLAPHLIRRPRQTFFIDTSRTRVSRPDSIQMPAATPDPSRTPPENEYTLPTVRMSFAGRTPPSFTSGWRAGKSGAALRTAKSARRSDTANLGSAGVETGREKRYTPSGISIVWPGFASTSAWRAAAASSPGAGAKITFAAERCAANANAAAAKKGRIAMFMAPDSTTNPAPRDPAGG